MFTVFFTKMWEAREFQLSSDMKGYDFIYLCLSKIPKVFS